MGTQQFLAILAPLERADLRLGVNRLDAVASRGVVEANVSISSAAASRQQRGLQWMPRQGLDSGRVVLDLHARGRAAFIPHHCTTTNLSHERIASALTGPVIIRARGQVLSIDRPAQPADLLLVSAQDAAHVRLSRVSLQNRGVARAGAQRAPIPRQRRHTHAVPCHSLYPFLRGYVIQQHLQPVTVRQSE